MHPAGPIVKIDRLLCIWFPMHAGSGQALADGRGSELPAPTVSLLLLRSRSISWPSTIGLDAHWAI